MQELKPDDFLKRLNFNVEILNKMYVNQSFLDDISFTDEATFHIKGCVIRYNSRLWGFGNPNESFEKHTSKVVKCLWLNVWCGVMENRVIGPFFFSEKTINRVVYHDMLINRIQHSKLDELENIQQLSLLSNKFPTR